MGAPKGNQNATKHIRNAIKRALSRVSNENFRAGLDQLADKIVKQALSGEFQSQQLIADRIDGKATQPIEARIEQTIVNLRDAEDLESRLTGKLEERTESVGDTVH
jgi:hypothetical protein